MTESIIYGRGMQAADAKSNWCQGRTYRDVSIWRSHRPASMSCSTPNCQRRGKGHWAHFVLGNLGVRLKGMAWTTARLSAMSTSASARLGRFQGCSRSFRMGLRKSNVQCLVCSGLCMDRLVACLSAIHLLQSCMHVAQSHLRIHSLAVKPRRRCLTWRSCTRCSAGHGGLGLWTQAVVVFQSGTGTRSHSAFSTRVSEEHFIYVQC